MKQPLDYARPVKNRAQYRVSRLARVSCILSVFANPCISGLVLVTLQRWLKLADHFVPLGMICLLDAALVCAIVSILRIRGSDGHLTGLDWVILALVTCAASIPNLALLLLLLR